MNVFAIGGGKRIEELKNRNNNFQVFADTESLNGNVENGDAIIHFWESESVDDLEPFWNQEGIYLILNSINSTLSEIALYLGEPKSNVIGFAGIPGFIDRDKWDVSSLNSDEVKNAAAVFKFFNVKTVEVQDRVGMVTPRIVSMIINEAYYTVMEGTAQKEDINTAMKLGTNYPEGPFNWVETIGVDHVYELLDAIYEDTKEERYKICPLLKAEYLKSIQG